MPIDNTEPFEFFKNYNEKLRRNYEERCERNFHSFELSDQNDQSPSICFKAPLISHPTQTHHSYKANTKDSSCPFKFVTYMIYGILMLLIMLILGSILIEDEVNALQIYFANQLNYYSGSMIMTEQIEEIGFETIMEK